MSNKFSIITVTRNSSTHLPTLYDSLKSQVFKDFEWVVVDGASTDGTLEFILKVAGLNFKYISEPDNGIYDAMNKAIRLCQGEYILFIGADDVLADQFVLEDVAKCNDSNVGVILGGVEDGRGVRFFSKLGLKTYLINTVHHQGAFYRRELFKYFLYDLRSRVVADYELNFILYIQRTPYYTVNRLISVCGPNGISNTTNEFKLYRDMHAIRSRHITGWLSYFFMLIGFCNVSLKKLRK